MTYTGSTSKLALDYAPIEVERSEGCAIYEFFSTPKGAPYYDNAMKLLSWRPEPMRGAELTSIFAVALP